MIFNFLKHLIVALLLDAGAALAFDSDAEPAAAVTVVSAQSCSVPAPQLISNDSGIQS